MTAILSRLSEGDRDAFAELFPLVYGELHSLADRAMRRERAGHTLQPTALTHEAYLRLLGQAEFRWQDRAHFLAVAAQAMRRILVDHARRKGRKKRGGRYERVSLSQVGAGPNAPEVSSAVDLVALDQALTKLAGIDERKARIVELLYFGGLTAAEAGEVLGVTSRTVERAWQYARLWLLRELTDQGPPMGRSRGDAEPAGG